MARLPFPAPGEAPEEMSTLAFLAPNAEATVGGTINAGAILRWVDEAAAADGLSVNSWLVRAVAAALQPRQRRPAQRAARSGDSFAGWAR